MLRSLLVDLNAENSEIDQKIRHSLFLVTPAGTANITCSPSIKHIGSLMSFIFPRNPMSRIRPLESATPILLLLVITWAWMLGGHCDFASMRRAKKLWWA